MQVLSKLALASVISLRIFSSVGAAPVPEGVSAGVPTHVDIECVAGQCSENDLAVLSKVLDMIQKDPEATKNWSVTSSIEVLGAAEPEKREGPKAVNKTALHHGRFEKRARSAKPLNITPVDVKHGITLTRRQNAAEVHNDLAGLDLQKIQHCAANDCSDEDLAAIKGQLEVATIPSWLWPILGSISKLKFNYSLDFELDPSKGIISKPGKGADPGKGTPKPDKGSE